MQETVTLKVDGKEYEFPVIVGTEGERGINIDDLRDRTGMVTFDRSYGNTGSCRSEITYLNGEEGILRYRGYPIEQLAEKSSFVEVCYLLINGKLPTRVELDNWKKNITQHTMLHEDFIHFYEGFPRNAHPMAILSSGVGILSTFYQRLHDSTSPEDLDGSIIRLLAKLPTVAAYAYKKSIGQPYVYPRNDLSYCGNFLNMMFSVPAEPYKVNPMAAKALGLLLILHADHEQNCSTSTVRLVGSSQANLYASVSAGIMALWGKLHGGANQAVMEMLDYIEKDSRNVKKFIDRVKNKEDEARLMGFGHRVYKNFDPRATIIKKACDELLKSLGVKDTQLQIAMELEEAALNDEYFISRKLYPNVDFYSGIMYKAMGFPADMFTVLFAIGRLPGWIAQWKEMVYFKSRIGRPRQIYVGPQKRDYVAVEMR